jgi:uncharacterized repeat protein (TIGR03803 family)
MPAAANAELVLHDFGGTPDGSRPSAPLLVDGAGNLYGTTAYGGAHNRGTVFTIKSDGTYMVLRDLAGGYDDGAVPFAALILGDAGNLYGTTFGGGAPTIDMEMGTVFRMQTDGTGFHIMHRFTGGQSDGALPLAGVILGGDGNLYGTTSRGGQSQFYCPVGSYSCGTVYSLTTDGSDTFRLLQAFPTSDCPGTFTDSPLVMDAGGNLYSTTHYGPGFFDLDFGTVFELKTDGTCTTLWTFQDRPDGSYPQGGLILDGAGNLYGTTSTGGTYGGGTVFQIGTDGSEAPIYSFRGPDGGYPQAALVLDDAGHLYGTTLSGGAGNGTVFTLLTDGSSFSDLYVFNGPDGNSPAAAVVRDGAGSLYGTTVSGGTSNQGVVFSLP